MVGGTVLGGILAVPALLLGGTSIVALTALFILSEAGYAITGWIYARRWLSETISIKIPTKYQAVWIVASALGMLAIPLIIEIVSSTTGIQYGRVDQQLLTGSPEMVLVLVVLSVVLIGPAEEYLFRGVIQGRLSQSMGASAAIVIASLLFVLPHAIGYTGGVGAIVLLSIAPFSLGLVMGALYEWFNNLSLPILAHGLYNATLFLTTYFTAF
ncbi:CPBP family intramembrane glutamic endopeptidase [Halalkalicoccus subterraneus]|uniref:CPBP family intramembrane glutamic endopeptidase n=1 Tax=Halalkalicoccus subterraneus TaxID=2675002 RepID=UPI001FE94BAE|nr:type II CAAX endopeptidase family protein [Halalkalicoccus subterraneus]